jgi:hypothetical protein
MLDSAGGGTVTSGDGNAAKVEMRPCVPMSRDAARLRACATAGGWGDQDASFYDATGGKWGRQRRQGQRGRPMRPDESGRGTLES